jgi:hypothetical protein
LERVSVVDNRRLVHAVSQSRFPRHVLQVVASLVVLLQRLLVPVPGGGLQETRRVAGLLQGHWFEIGGARLAVPVNRWPTHSAKRFV